MKLLLDTHIWIWLVLEPSRISQQVTSHVQNTANELWLSPISVWEVLLLHRKGRILPDVEIDSWISKTLRSFPVNEANVTLEVARQVGRLQLAHRDPADHFLVATAKVFDLTLVTADDRLLTTPDISILGN
jgi:PIN domain nuclease of toxin-antitoxin system